MHVYKIFKASKAVQLHLLGFYRTQLHALESLTLRFTLPRRDRHPMYASSESLSAVAFTLKSLCREPVAATSMLEDGEPSEALDAMSISAYVEHCRRVHAATQYLKISCSRHAPYDMAAILVFALALPALLVDAQVSRRIRSCPTPRSGHDLFCAQMCQARSASAPSYITLPCWRCVRFSPAGSAGL